MSTKLTVSNLPNFRKSTLALHRINNMVNGNEMTSSTNHDGFDDLRHFIKAGGEFSKELASTLSDRAELEATYAKGLAKLAAKLFKVKYLETKKGTNFYLTSFYCCKRMLFVNCFMSCLLVQTLVIDKSLPQILQQYIVQLCISSVEKMSHFAFWLQL